MTTRLAPEDLVLAVGLPPPRGVRRWLCDGLRSAIRDGSVVSEATLPSSRRAADALGVSRGTVTEAYDQLVGEGFLQTRDRSAVVVASRVETTRRSPLAAEPTVPASPGVPDPALFPRAAWARALRAAVADARPDQLGYPPAAGLLELRRALAEHLHRTRGAQVQPADVAVVDGVAQALHLLASVLRVRGVGVVAVENPGSPGAISQFSALGLAVRPTTVDGDGLRVDELDTDVGAVLVTPAHQFPLGVVLAPERRRALAAWAATDGGIVIEDDYDAELRYDRRPVGSLQGMAPESVVLTGSVSKTLSPALRLGWLVAPADLLGELVAAKERADHGSSAFEQLALAQFLDSGAYQRHVRRVRQEYRRRRTDLLETLRRTLPGLAVEGVSAGLHLVVRLADADSEVDAVGRLRGIGAVVLPLSAAYDRDPQPGLILGTSRTRPTPSELAGALAPAGAIRRVR